MTKIKTNYKPYQGVVTEILSTDPGGLIFSVTFPQNHDKLQLKIPLNNKPLLHLINLILATAEAVIMYKSPSDWKILLPSRFETVAKAVEFEPLYSPDNYFLGGLYKETSILLFEFESNL